jgi:hypothetical protein
MNIMNKFKLNGAVAQFGRALESHSRGRGFDSHQLHNEVKSCAIKSCQTPSGPEGSSGRQISNVTQVNLASFF